MIKDNLLNMGLTAKDLDNIVKDAASTIAGHVNNEGMRRQLEYLSGNGYSDKDILREIFLKYLKPGVIVSVSDPKHNDSNHTEQFYGMVEDIHYDYLTVQDNDGCSWDIQFDEIDKFEHLDT